MCGTANKMSSSAYVEDPRRVDSVAYHYLRTKEPIADQEYSPSEEPAKTVGRPHGHHIGGLHHAGVHVAGHQKPDDLLTTATTATKNAFDKCVELLRHFQKSPMYKILFFAQPAHVIMLLAITLVAASMFPNNMKKTNTVDGQEHVKPRTFVNFVYLAAFCTHVGAQFWMTFISGLSLYFNLARHAFGDVQKILFPKYFSLNSLLSAITLIQFGKMHVTSNVWDMHTYLQVFVLSLCFLLELIIRLYVVPPLLKLITIKMAIEKSAGVGTEVGHYDIGPLVNCPHYMAIHRAFRQVHLCVAIGNIVTMMCTSFHLMYIAS
ncbi:transmembrane protein 205 [Daktulosphaira vitifoliae]|uniref:transmembrane protein 205 n=1 Tax=Daktulosphaira vitifoliae TaxID=58002 RepID=UPI0021AB07EC|nr:transmembrane protein 205 [Daktulosphaira vitifoliae]